MTMLTPLDCHQVILSLLQRQIKLSTQQPVIDIVEDLGIGFLAHEDDDFINMTLIFNPNKDDGFSVDEFESLHMVKTVTRRVNASTPRREVDYHYLLSDILRQYAKAIYHYEEDESFYVLTVDDIDIVHMHMAVFLARLVGHIGHRPKEANPLDYYHLLRQLPDRNSTLPGPVNAVWPVKVDIFTSVCDYLCCGKTVPAYDLLLTMTCKGRPLSNEKQFFRALKDNKVMRNAPFPINVVHTEPVDWMNQDTPHGTIRLSTLLPRLKHNDKMDRFLCIVLDRYRSSGIVLPDGVDYWLDRLKYFRQKSSSSLY